MPLEAIHDLVGHAYRKGYGIGYFESWNLESLQGVIDAAEKTCSPIIIGFNGEFLSDPRRDAVENLAWYGALGKAAAETAKVPCGFIFNECPDEHWVQRAIKLGFNLVMLVDPDVSYEEYLQRIKRITEIAHANSVAVEAELDTLPFGGNSDAPHTSQISNVGGTIQANCSTIVRTEPRQLAEFVEATCVDLMAVSIGNIHVSLRGKFNLDLQHLSELRDAVPVPLVLHGGSGIASESLSAAVTLGVAKVNFGTYLKQRYLGAVRRAYGTENANPHQSLGIGRSNDIMVVGRHAVRDAVLDRIHLLGCCGRA